MEIKEPLDPGTFKSIPLSLDPGVRGQEGKDSFTPHCHSFSLIYRGWPETPSPLLRGPFNADLDPSLFWGPSPPKEPHSVLDPRHPVHTVKRRPSPNEEGQAEVRAPPRL